MLGDKGKLNPECVPFLPSTSTCKGNKVSYLDPFSEPFVPSEAKVAARSTPPHKRIHKPTLTLHLNSPSKLDVKSDDSPAKLDLKSDDSIATSTSKYTIGITMDESKEAETSMQPQSIMDSPPKAKNEVPKTRDRSSKTRDENSGTKLESTNTTVKPSVLPHLRNLPAKTKVPGTKTPEITAADIPKGPATYVTADALRSESHAKQARGDPASDMNIRGNALEQRHRVQAASIEVHMPSLLPADSSVKSWLDNLGTQSNTQPSVSAPLQGDDLIDLDFDEGSREEATAAGASKFTPDVAGDRLDHIKNTAKVPTGSQHPAQDDFQAKVLAALEQLPDKVGDGSNITVYLQDLLAKMKVELPTTATARGSPPTPEDEGYNTAASTDPLSKNKGDIINAAPLNLIQDNIKVPQTYDGASNGNINVSTSSEDNTVKVKEAAKLADGAAFLAVAGSALNEVAASGKYGKGRKLLRKGSQTEEPVGSHEDQFFDPVSPSGNTILQISRADNAIVLCRTADLGYSCPWWRP